MEACKDDSWALRRAKAVPPLWIGNSEEADCSLVVNEDERGRDILRESLLSQSDSVYITPWNAEQFLASEV